jgi:hypothetical protein
MKKLLLLLLCSISLASEAWGAMDAITNLAASEAQVLDQKGIGLTLQKE